MIHVYIASRFKHQPEARKLRDQILALGLGCTSRWLEEEPSLGNFLSEDHKRKIAAMDLLDVRRAQALLLFNPEEDRTYGTGGCHVETGYALALGIPVFVLGCASNVFHSLPGVHVFGDVDPSVAFDRMSRYLKASVVDFGPTWDEVSREEAAHERIQRLTRRTVDRPRNGDLTCGECGAGDGAACDVSRPHLRWAKVSG